MLFQKKLIWLFFLIITASFQASAQKYDSVKIYAITMNASYNIRIDKDIIKSEVDSVLVFRDAGMIKKIDDLFTNKIADRFIKNIKTNYIDLRLSVEFYKENKIIKEIGVTPYKKMFINKKLYSYQIEDLKLLNHFTPLITSFLGLK